MAQRNIVIAGAGGFGREVAWLAAEIAAAGSGAPRIECFADDGLCLRTAMVNAITVKSLESARRDHPDASLVPAIGSPSSRQELVRKAADQGWSFTTLMHPRVERSRWVEIGEGSIICAGTILTVNIVLGNHVHLNLDCTIGHDCVIEDFVTLAPGVHVSGNVRIERGAYVGTGAAIINGREGQPLVIGAGAVVGAGACVTKDVPEGVTVVGVPARPKGL